MNLSDLFVAEFELTNLDEKLGGLREVQSQLSWRDLGQLVLYPKRRQAELRSRSGRNRHLKIRGRDVQEQLDQFISLRIADTVEVIEKQHDRTCRLGNVVNKVVQNS